jgi:alpha-galactosidase
MRSFRCAAISLIALLFGFAQASAMTNRLALTPPMGLNTWYHEYTAINETIIKAIADQMVTNGLKDAGYEYLCLDDGWSGFRDADGTIVADTNKFPSGMKALADYVHSKGLKIGLYTVFGPLTCALLPGSYGHVEQDANTYAEWGIDYVKYEACSSPAGVQLNMRTEYERMGAALKATGRPIIYNCSIVDYEPWMRGVMHSWRGTSDHDFTWSNVLHHIDFAARTPEAAGPGGWNDPDVIPLVGFLYTPSLVQWRSIFSMWCILAAPLLTPRADAIPASVLTNREAIAVNQDAAGIQGRCVSTNGDLQVWRKPLGSSNSHTIAVALFNRGANTSSITARWSDLGLPSGVALVRDLWAHAVVGHFTNSYTAVVPGHGVAFLKLTYGHTTPLPTHGTNYLSDLDWLATATTGDPHWTVIDKISYPIQRDKSVGRGPLRIRGIQYQKGLGVHANSHLDYYVGRAATRFEAIVGVDDEACCGIASLRFQVRADGVLLHDSGVLTSSSPAHSIDVDIVGRTILSLDVEGEALNGHADWADATLTVNRPAIRSITMRGADVVISGAGAYPNLAFHLLTSSNVNAPPSYWVLSSTNFFDGQGKFSFTNRQGAGPMFYRIAIP